MSKRKIYPLKFFIAHIPLIDGDERNVWLNLLADRIHRDYGLYGKKLLRCLQGINAKRCKPPLDDGVVKGIAGLFKKSDMRQYNTDSTSQKRSSKQKK
jgi:hypothetical protein